MAVVGQEINILLASLGQGLTAPRTTSHVIGRHGGVPGQAEQGQRGLWVPAGPGSVEEPSAGQST